MATYKSIKYAFDGSNVTNTPTATPTVSSISPASVTEASLPTNITITGTNFTSGQTVTFRFANGTEISSPTVTHNSATEKVAQAPATLGGVNSDPIDIVIGGGGAGEGSNLLTIDDNPIFATASGSIGTIGDGQRSSYSLSPVTATDPEGVSVTYAIQSGSLPTGLSLNTSSGAITGTAGAVGSDTTSTFTIRATAGSQTSDRQFTITVKAPFTETFTSLGAGTYTPTSTQTVQLLVVAGGGGGDGGSTGGHNGGGGGGGLVFHPSYSITSGQAIPFFVGDGNPQSSPDTGTGQNSVFGATSIDTSPTVITALGGGASNTGDGGSGGGKSHGSGSGGSAIQTTSPLISSDSQTYGFGNNGGSAPGAGPCHPSGGGGGAGGTGSGGAHGNQAGGGGSGKDMSASFGTSVGVSGFFSGGGGGGTHQGGNAGSGQHGGGNGRSQGNSGIGNNGTSNTGGGAGSDAKGGSGIIILKG